MQPLKQNEKKVFNQDLSVKASEGSIFVIHLFFREKPVMPSNELLTGNLSKRLGNVECISYSGDSAFYAAKDYTAEFQDANVPVMLSIMTSNTVNEIQLDSIALSQMWDCPDSQEILSNSQYHVVAMDMLGGGIRDYRKRAHMLCEYAEALVELFPLCTAILFQSSGKMYRADDFRSIHVEEDARFIKYAVNARFFNIEGTDDMMVDTLGMHVLNLPDLQYHFHTMDPNWVVEHAYNVCSYNYDKDAPIESGETIDGITEGRIDGNIQWVCQYEDALIQPVRPVMDINMGEFAAGTR